MSTDWVSTDVGELYGKAHRKQITRAWGELQDQVAAGAIKLDPVQQTMFDMMNLLIFDLLEMKSKQATAENNAKFVKALEGG